MKLHYAILLFCVFGKSFGFKPNHKIERQSKSIFSKKKCKETFTPARYQARIKDIKCDQPAENMPELYFPVVDYPTNAMEASKPYFYKACEGNAMIGPFPDDVKSSFKTLREKNKQKYDGIKAKYMNDYTMNVNSRIHCKENAGLHPTIIEENITILGDNSTEMLNETCVEVINEEDGPAVLECTVEEKDLTDTTNETCVEVINDEDVLAISEYIVKEKDLIDTTSESEESEEIEDKIMDVVESEASEDVVEEEALDEDRLQSWESGQMFSEENIDEEMIQNEAENSTSGIENIQKEVADEGSEEVPEEVVSEILEPENPSDKETELCPSPPVNKANATPCDKKTIVNNMKLLQKMRKKNYLKRQQVNRKPNINIPKKL